ncbi:Intradiol ring-cleavage dioxygenase [Xylogone sp. PMI_703]|nr:Intradiol ring-cleavage dioxygenase [Xylogone sp. PMI_703]
MSNQWIPLHSKQDPLDMSRFDTAMTEAVANATGPKANPRLREVIANLTRHLHAFCRESQITRTEFMAAIGMINRAGQMSDDRRNGGLLLSDVLGMEPVIDNITYVLAEDAATVPTVLGPFWRENAPRRTENGDNAWMYGTLDVWETVPNGKYEQQDPDQIDMNLRGRFLTGGDGKYDFYCLRPTTYAIPDDGPAGDLLKLLDRHPMRLAHIHFIVRDKHVYDDAVFAVKEDLIVDFLPREGDPKAKFQLEYNFKLAAKESKPTL